MMLRRFFRITLTVLLGLNLLGAVALSAEPNKDNEKKDASVREVEMFAAIQSGELEVTLIPKDSSESTVLFKNNTGELLSVKLPDVFAGVPVLKQMMGGMGGMGGGMGGMGGMGGGMGGMGGGMGGMGQGMGGGFGGGMMGGMGGGMGGGMMGGMGGGMGGMGGGMFRVRPDKIGKVKVACVCLEHGKTEPNSRMKYQLIPLEQFTQEARTIEVCRMLARGEIPQNTAQAAVWHTANGLAWGELAQKDRVRLLNGYTEKYFHPRELMFASRVVAEAERRAESREEIPGKADSLSQRR